MGNAARPILVVDDNAATRYASTRVLRGAGYHVVEAATGTECLEHAKHRLGLVILDVHLPDMSGFDVCRQFRTIDHCAAVPVIHISATSVSDEDKVAGLEAGADAYLVHPVDPAVLVATVEAFLRARRAEEARSESDAKFRTIFDQGNAFAGIIGLDGKIADLNHSLIDIGGMPRDEALGSYLWDAPWWRSADFIREGLQRAVQECSLGITYRSELPFWTGAGEERIIDFHLTPVTDSSHEIIFNALVGVEVTERRRAERENIRLIERLKEVDQKKDEFLATLAHELRNPLAPIQNGLQLLNQNPDGASEHVREILVRQVSHLVRLVDDLLDVSRISSGKLELRVQPLSLRKVMESAVETSEPVITAKKHQLELDLPPPELVVDGDPVRLSQIFSNLLNNAAKYTRPKGEIHFTTANHGGRVVVSVRDNGAGIASEHLAEVFGVFNQLRESRSSAAGGLGVGLSLAKTLVELHGGEIRIESAGLGKGTTVNVDLPISSQMETVEAAPEYAPSAGAEELRVLVVDDNRDNAAMLSMLLNLSGHKIETANTGKSAIELGASLQPHVAFVDIGLPDISGREVASNLREQFGEEILLVALSGYGTSEDKARSLEAGFDLHITKPAPRAELEKVLTAASKKMKE